MSSTGFRFGDIDKGSISIPITCVNESRTFYCVYVAIQKEDQGSIRKIPKMVFHPYTDFETLSKSIKISGVPKLPSKIDTSDRKIKLEKYIRDLYVFLCDKEAVYRDPFTKFISKGALDLKTAFDRIKEQREKDHHEIVDMLKITGEVPTAYSWNKPLFCFFGHESSGKSSIINFLWGLNFRKVGDTQTDTGYTIIESVPEEEFAKYSTDYKYIKVENRMIIDNTEGFSREGTVFKELSSIMTLNRYQGELKEIRHIFEKNGSLLKSVLINEKYLHQVVSRDEFNVLKTITVLDSYGINSVNIREGEDRKEVTTFFIRNSFTSAILCGGQSIPASHAMYKFICDCAVSAYKSKEEIRKKIEERIANDPNNLWMGIAGFAKMAAIFFFPMLSKVATKTVNFFSGTDASAPEIPQEQGGSASEVIQPVSALENIRFLVTKMDDYESFESKAYEFGLWLGKSFENPPIFDSVYFVSLKGGSIGKENCKKFLDKVKKDICERNPNKEKDESIKLMADRLSEGGFFSVDMEKLLKITEHVTERLKLWELGIKF